MYNQEDHGVLYFQSEVCFLSPSQSSNIIGSVLDGFLVTMAAL